MDKMRKGRDMSFTTPALPALALWRGAHCV
jgi:hypothetical protein